MKKIVVGILLSLLVFSLAGCQETTRDKDEKEERAEFVRVDEDEDEDEDEDREREDRGDEEDMESVDSAEDGGSREEPVREEYSEEESETTDVETLEERFDYGTFKNSDFWFSSGAGAWSTSMHINSDGSFSGGYSDMDMGSTGDGHPYGTMYVCNFTGRFSKAVKVNEYTYSMQVEELNYQNTPGEEEIKDGILYIHSEAYGISEGKEFLIYTPDAPVDALSEDFRMWAMYSIPEGSSTLGFYGLCNVKMQYGFCESEIYN